MNDEYQDPRARILKKLEQVHMLWDTADPTKRKKMIAVGGIFLLLMGSPVFLSSSPCSSRDTYDKAKEIYGRFFAVESITGGKRISTSKYKQTTATMCGANLTLSNGEVRSIRYEVAQWQGVSLVVPKLDKPK